MTTKTEFGDAQDLVANLGGGDSNIVYLLDANYNEVVRQYNEIKSEKTIIGAYSMGRKHCLVLITGGIVKKKIRRKKTGVK